MKMKWVGGYSGGRVNQEFEFWIGRSKKLKGEHRDAAVAG